VKFVTILVLVVPMLLNVLVVQLILIYITTNVTKPAQMVITLLKVSVTYVTIIV
jgi:hypothetical protein